MPAQAPRFYGSANSLTPARGANLDKDAFGLDVLTRPFTVPRATAKTSVPKIGTADTYHTNLRATGNYSLTEDDGLMCTLNVDYRGFLNGRAPNPKKVNSKVLQCVSIPVSISDPSIPAQYDVDLTLQFLAIKTAWSWFENKKPKDTPRYSGVDSSASPWENIKFVQAMAGTLVVDSSTILDAMKDAGRQTSIEFQENYVVEDIVPGYLWKCSLDMLRTINPIQAKFIYVI